MQDDYSHLDFVPPSHPVLSQVAEPIPHDEISSSATQALIARMKEKAGLERGNPRKKMLVGLAAPQLGVAKRVILVNVEADGKGGTKAQLNVYINPVITYRSSDTTEWYEGCYSTGNVTGIVFRARQIKIRAYNEKGEEVTEEHSDYAARIFQHEIDHLDGIRFPSRIQNPEHLHWVDGQVEGQWEEYRNKEGWRNWDVKCSWECWEALKKGGG